MKLLLKTSLFLCCLLASIFTPVSFAKQEAGSSNAVTAQQGNALKPTGGRNAQWAEAIDAENNFYRIEADLYRSAQPEHEQLPLMKKLGIRTVINLRQYNSDQKLLEGSGIREIRIPLRTWNIDDADVVSVLAAVEAARKNGPVLIHCQHGADRTGLISALYRMIYQGWNRQQALDELKNGGYGFHSIWTNIPRYIERADVEKLRRELK